MLTASSLQPPASSLVFEETVVNLGRVKATGNISQRFGFRVVGNEPIQIVELRPSCGCLRPVLSKRVYQPGESGEIVLVIHTTSQKPGKKEFRLGVTLRDPDPRYFELTVNVELFSEITIQPSNLLVYLGGGQKQLRQVVTITDRRPRKLQITELISSSTKIKPRLIPSEKPGSNVQRIEILIDADFSFGHFEERIIVLTSDEEYSSLEIPITVQRKPPIRVFPDRLTLLHRDLDEGLLEQQIQLLTSPEAPAGIQKVTCDQPGIECTFEKASDHRWSIRVLIDPRALDPPIRTQIHIQLRQPFGMELTVPLQIE